MRRIFPPARIPSFSPWKRDGSGLVPPLITGAAGRIGEICLQPPPPQPRGPPSPKSSETSAWGHTGVEPQQGLSRPRSHRPGCCGRPPPVSDACVATADGWHNVSGATVGLNGSTVAATLELPPAVYVVCYSPGDCAGQRLNHTIAWSVSTPLVFGFFNETRWFMSSGPPSGARKNQPK